jgi:acetyl-CoA carboxylase biotin carboxyl carrier protein
MPQRRHQGTPEEKPPRPERVRERKIHCKMTEKPLPVDAGAVETLARILSETGLSEIEYESGSRRIRVARHPVPAAPAWPFPAASFALPAEPAHALPAPSPAGDGGVNPDLFAVTSPMVGTAYLASAPGQTPFVKVGDMVKEGQTVVIVEAMKVMNPVKSPRAGRVERIFVADGQPVEFGEPLVGLV